MDVYKNNQKIVLIFLFVLLDYLAIVVAEQSAVFLGIGPNFVVGLLHECGST